MLVILQDMIEEHQSCKSNAPLHMKQDTTSIEKKPLEIASNLDIHIPAVIPGDACGA